VEEAAAFYLANGAEGDGFFHIQDMPPQSFLGNVEHVFQNKTGEIQFTDKDGSEMTLSIHNKKQTKCIGIGGEKDDITLEGQHIIPGGKDVMIPGVGHYGLWQGYLYENYIRLMIHNFQIENDPDCGFNVLPVPPLEQVIADYQALKAKRAAAENLQTAA
jgi:poly-beta-hydroxyalkanoate depolymerase